MYGSIEGVKDNLPQIADKIVPSPTHALQISESKVERYLMEFSSQVDSLLSDRYLIPLKSSTGETPDVIDSIVNNLASYKLARRQWTTFQADENKLITSLRSDAKEMLTSLSEGKAVLHDVPAVNKDTSSLRDFLDDQTQGQEQEEYFTMGDPAEWQDKL